MTIRSAALLFCVAVFAMSPACAEKIADPIVVTGGQIRGVDTKLPGVRAYKGIPFAAPPLGELRWKAPQPVVPWHGVRTCDEFGPACPQPTSPVLLQPLRQNEDCLTLNVWTAAKSTDEKRPVMVWIHGGGHTTGGSAQPFYDGAQFAASGVVLVSINYRLGPLGYLAHPQLSEESPRHVSGNYGTLDQIAALAWVQRNIGRFGGDPGNVTIFGESAGGVSCGVLLVSPLAKGLFHRVILESGVPVGVRSRLREGDNPAETVGRTVFERLGVKNLAEARRKSPEALLTAVKPRVGLLDRGLQYGPLIDGWVLPDVPLKLVEEGKFNRVPILAGTNADEATLFTSQFQVRGAMGYRLAARLLLKQHTDEVLKIFPSDYAGSPDKTFEKLVTIAAFVAPTRALLRMAGKYQPDTYLYHFTRVSPVAKASGKGATHGLEIAYVFRHEGRALVDPIDAKLSAAMQRYWIQFARNGNPNVPGLPAWPRYETASDEHLEFGDAIRMKSGLFKEPCDLLERIFRESYRTGQR